jgi:hypothetical protein
MADYKFKETVVQAMQINEADFEVIYNWALQFNSASDKTDTSFRLHGNGEYYTVKKDSNVWIMKNGNDWLVLSDKRMNQLFQLV